MLAEVIVVTASDLIDFLNTVHSAQFYFKYHFELRELFYRLKYILDTHTVERAREDITELYYPQLVREYFKSAHILNTVL